MKTTPGYPGNPLPPVRVESEPTPRSYSPPPGELQIRGNGWKVSAPIAVLVSVVAALGVKMLPTQSTPDAEARAEARLEAMRNAEFREEMRRALAAQGERQARMETEVSSLRISIDAVSKRLEKLERDRP